MSVVDIILVNYNGAVDTISCIESLWQMDYRDFRVIIVENGSTDDSLSLLESFVQGHNGKVISKLRSLESVEHNKLSLLISETNIGFSAGNNMGIRFALSSPDSAFIWLLNNDSTIKNDALSKLVEGYKNRQDSGQNIGILGSKILFYHYKGRIQGIGGTFNFRKVKIKLIGFNEPDTGQYDGRGENLDWVLGASMFADRAFIKKVGMLNEDYFLYFEELDWSHRAKKSGFITSCETSSVVYHKQGQSTKNHVLGSKSEFALYHNFTSLLKFYESFYPRLIYRAKFRILIRLIMFKIKRKISFWPLFLKIFFKQ